ncbi:hypothetical protein [Sinorhizobium terangae]|uniref:Uncharacterized protein n=1 Tax=Sinorhizobium terangae TaxID=110322 RepID=A0A6N7LSZ2_SINTE|nr:hypothetical protein [Sinorhizobium terangae]MBB4184751.1 hypothetical protein [Sinorhizobium terangae]MQX19204.1 hypothetical protein [Sinorhizobium terangae]WFU50676.1 hypothetical protein QA637_28435 [Sinorhizobium terangae]
MFYLGGMTLGYFEPPVPKAFLRDKKVASTVVRNDVSAEHERDQEQEWARAFLTPWHLLY